MKSRERRRLSMDTIAELMQKPALTLREAADILDITTDLFWKKLRAGEGPAHFQIGRVTYIRPDSLQAWLKKLETSANRDPGGNKQPARETATS